MVERKEVEELLELVDAEKGRWSPHVPAPTLAALCRAWLALDAAIAALSAQQPSSDGGFTAADMMDARQEGRKEARFSGDIPPGRCA